MTGRFSINTRWVCCALGTLLLTAPLASGQGVKVDAHGFMAAQPEELMPGEGRNSVVIAGDPSKPGIYVVRNRFAPGSGSKPHFHSQDRFITVIKGTWYVALGPDADVYNPDKMMAMKAGSFIKHPAGGHHYDGAKEEEAIVQIMGMGPVTTTQLTPPTGSGQR
jgi:quercetin dioxygenase-like cupin family protein